MLEKNFPFPQEEEFWMETEALPEALEKEIREDDLVESIESLELLQEEELKEEPEI